jgi:membrane protein implicated in regulation of membrane protease activity
MLRSVLVFLGLAALGLGALCLLIGADPPAYTLLIWGAVLLAAIVYERFRYKPLASASPGSGWQRTSERFVDPDSGKTVTVYLQPSSGERQYVEE